MGRFLRLTNGLPTSQDETSIVTIYDQRITVGSTITVGTNITLPAAGTYNSAELEVYLNGIRLDVILDYNYVSTPPRTQIVMVLLDLVVGDELRFRVDRVP